MRSFLRRRLWVPLREILRQGLTPELLAASLAIGLALGVCPIIGLSTPLCVVVAQAARHNHPAMQLSNYLASPVQVLLLIPFVRLGELLFRAPRLPLTASQFLAHIEADKLGTLRLFWTSAWHAVAAWAMVAPVVAALLTLTLIPAVRRLDRWYRLQAGSRA
jgi:uncharacterized protein (DUF2062 family)